MCETCKDTGMVKYSDKSVTDRNGATIWITDRHDACPDCSKIAEILYKEALIETHSEV